MAFNERQLLEALNDAMRSLDEPVSGYHDEALERLAAIVRLEHQNRVKSLPIQKEVSAQCKLLGDFRLAQMESTEA